MNNTGFFAADILLPKADYEKWSVVACDQFTSEPHYWAKTKEITEGYNSTYNLVLPEAYLSSDNSSLVASINANMSVYLEEGIFNEYKDAMIFVERTLPKGKVRYGIVGAVDLEEYDFSKGSKSLIRATEGTVLERIPPRVEIRKDAPLELPHVMLLIDDIERTVIEPLKNAKLTVLYDFELMQGGGHLKGSLIPKDMQEKILCALEALKAKGGESPLLFAVGDGNHSLATAKTCYNNAPNELNKYALTEIVNIHDEALEFEPIYRVIFNVDTDDFIKELTETFTDGPKTIEWYTKDSRGEVHTSGLTVGSLQPFIDSYLAKHPEAECDYIHGVESTLSLANADNRVGLIFDGMDKSELFPFVCEKGSLPRKTFSMGEAESKRYYTEARKIVK
ncbi:MAG: DUF1015 domain-containing protein [Ruminococcaceae bacterium]|nr:DUF1015 domain-containing protein [Oscillospiraceae bacterium]